MTGALGAAASPEPGITIAPLAFASLLKRSLTGAVAEGAAAAASCGFIARALLLPLVVMAIAVILARSAGFCSPGPGITIGPPACWASTTGANHAPATAHTSQAAAVRRATMRRRGCGTSRVGRAIVNLQHEARVRIAF
jgi:hypothetical protein